MVTASTLGLTLICVLWWLYFDVVSLVGEIRLTRLTGSARNALARDSYSYLHLLMILGIVLIALGLKKTLIDLGDPLKAIPAWALFGGVALYLLGHIAFRYRNIGKVNGYRLAATGVMLIAAPFAVQCPGFGVLELRLHRLDSSDRGRNHPLPRTAPLSSSPLDAPPIGGTSTSTCAGTHRYCLGSDRQCDSPHPL